jgi:hypothetical protein
MKSETTATITCSVPLDRKKRFEDYAKAHNLEGPILLGLLVQSITDPNILPSEIKADLRASVRFLIRSLTDVMLSFDHCVQDRLRIARSLRLEVSQEAQCAAQKK